MGDTQLRGLSRVIVQDVKVFDPRDETKLMLSADTVSFNFSLLGLILNLNHVSGALTGIELDNPVLNIEREERGWNLNRLVNLKDNQTKRPLELLLTVRNGVFVFRGFEFGQEEIPVQLDGSLEIDADLLALRQVRVGLFGAELTGNGIIGVDDTNVTLESNEVDFASFVQHFPQFSDLGLEGTAKIQATMAGPVFDPVVEGSLRIEKGALQTPLFDNATYRVDLLQGDFRYSKGEMYVHNLAMRKDDSTIAVAGTVGLDGSLKLATTMESFDIAASIPKALDSGISGLANFKGTLTGSFKDPLLQGEVSLAQGGVFLGRPVDRVRGNISLSTRKLTVNNLVLQQESARYRLSGEMQFRGLTMVNFALDLESGNPRDVLAVLGYEADFGGRVSGKLQFVGPVWNPDIYGDVKLHGGTLWGHTFDETQATFSISRDRIVISEGRSTYRDGVITFRGGGVRGEPLRLDVQASRWQWGTIDSLLTEGSDQQIPSEGEVVNLTGRAYLSGTLARPEATIEAVVSDTTAKEYHLNLEIGSRN